MGPIIVSGMGRCGTSLVMQMLHAANIPTTGEWPGFEDDHTRHPFDSAWLGDQVGRAVKVLDPHRFRPIVPLTSYVIWLDRDAVQQAASQIKFAKMPLGVPAVPRDAQRRWIASLRAERADAMAALRGPARWLRLDFERIVCAPFATAQAIADFLAPEWPGLDVERMANCVEPRKAGCLPDMLEVVLLKRGDPRAAEAADG